MCLFLDYHLLCLLLQITSFFFFNISRLLPSSSSTTFFVFFTRLPPSSSPNYHLLFVFFSSLSTACTHACRISITSGASRSGNSSELHPEALADKTIDIFKEKAYQNLPKVGFEARRRETRRRARLTNGRINIYSLESLTLLWIYTTAKSTSKTAATTTNEKKK